MVRRCGEAVLAAVPRITRSPVARLNDAAAHVPFDPIQFP
jgi:hypothetical protein